MKKLFSYLKGIPQAKQRILVLVLLSMAVIPTLVNLLFASDELRNFLDNQLYLFCLGLIIYGIWLLLLYKFKKQDNVQWKHLSLTKKEIKKGLVFGFAVYVLVNAWLVASVLMKGGNLVVSKGLSSIEFILTALGLFTFNIFLGAFIEEVINRAYLIPQAFRLVSRSLKNKIVALFFSVIVTQVLFALAHLPRDLFRFDSNLSALLNRQEDLFLSGIIYALVYLRTRNVIFLSMYHAFLNYGMPVISTEVYLTTNYNIVVLFVLVFWNKIMPVKETEAAQNLSWS